MTNMANTYNINPAYSNIARPYALAAFEYARDKKELSAWQAYLDLAASTITQSDTKQVLANPDIPASDWLALFQDVLGESLTREKQHFLSLLIQNKRLVILPEIAALFNDYYATLQKNSHIRIVTAIPLEPAQKQILTKTLSERIQEEVILQCDVDPQILGGAVIYIDDKAIDASIRGKLTRLLEFSLR